MKPAAAERTQSYWDPLKFSLTGFGKNPAFVVYNRSSWKLENLVFHLYALGLFLNREFTLALLK